MKKTIGVYIHIPFCVKKCNYCDFISLPISDKRMERPDFGNCSLDDDISSYLRALCDEIRGSRDLAEMYTVDTVFIGGGTPSLLSARQMEELLGVLKETYTLSEDAEISMEMNPGTVKEKELNVYRSAGINRVSVGLQSACDSELKRLGRIHTYQEFEETFSLLRECGFRNVNVDLMQAIPGQTMETCADTLEKVTTLLPEHISSYSLIIEEGTPFYDLYSDREGRKLFPDEETDRQMYAFTSAFLQNRGYRRYEISNYAREGFACRHNLKYWQMEEYIGFGLSGASYYGKKRYKNVEHMEDYLNRETRERKREVTALSATDEMEEYMFLGLRTMRGIDPAAFYERFRVPVRQIYGPVIDRYVKMGLLAKDSFVRLTERGIDVSNTVMADFLLSD